MKLGILGTGMIVKDVLTMYHELGVEKTYLFSTKKSKSLSRPGSVTPPRYQGGSGSTVAGLDSAPLPA